MKISYENAFVRHDGVWCSACMQCIGLQLGVILDCVVMGLDTLRLSLLLFKIAVLVYQCLNSQAPSYLADDCQLVSDIRPRRLRSSDSGFCAIRRSRTTYGDRCFAAAGPRVWNSLPTELRQSDSLAQFKRRLKTHLFGLWDHSALSH